MTIRNTIAPRAGLALVAVAMGALSIPTAASAQGWPAPEG